MMRLLRAVLSIGFAATLAWSANPPMSLDEVQRETNLEKRAGLALSFARPAVGRMVQAYAEGDRQQAAAILDSIVQAAVLAHDALAETGKHARSKPKHFKKAEIDTRRLLRDLEGAQRELTFDERPDLDPAIAKVSEINRQLLLEIMESKKN